MNKKVDSAVFSKTEVNRDSLEPLAVSTSGESVIHRQVTKDKVAEGFSLSRGHPVYPVKLPSKSVSFSIGELTPNAKTSNHRHALSSDRPYRERWVKSKILEYIRAEAGTRFDPEIVKLFLKLVT